MGLFRLAAVVAVGVSLLPSDREKQEQLYQRAAQAATWTVTFCERNAATCAQAQSLWGEFQKKAEFGAKMAYDAVKERDGETVTGSVLPSASQTRQSESPAANTLTRDDLKPQWRGKMAGKPGL